MSINDPISIVWDKKRAKYYLQQGRETFYDQDNLRPLFDPIQNAAAYRCPILTGQDPITRSHPMTAKKTKYNE